MKSILLPLVFAVASFVSAAPPATAAVSKAQREAILVVGPIPVATPSVIRSAYGDPAQLLASAQATLGASYNAVHTLAGSSCGFALMINRISQVASNSSVKAIDLVLVGYGVDNKIHFLDGAKTGADVEKYLTHLSSTTRAKLRVVFSTTSFGKSHNSNWRTGGFASAAGAKKICVDARLAVPAFLAAWTSGQSFSSAVTAANNAGHALDLGVAAQAIVTNPGLVSSIDSTRVIAGSETKTINSNP